MIYLPIKTWAMLNNQMVILQLTTIKRLDRAYLTDQPVDPEANN